MVLPDSDILDHKFCGKIRCAGRISGPLSANRKINQDVSGPAIRAVVMTPLVRSLHYKKIVNVVPNHGRRPLHCKSMKTLGVVKSGMISLIVVQQGAAGYRLSSVFPVQVMETTACSVAPIIDNFDHVDLRGPFSVLRVKPKGGPHTPPTGHLHATFKISIFPSPFEIGRAHV